MKNKFSPGCCCGSGVIVGPCADGTIRVIAMQNCDASSASGAAVTLKLGGTTIGTGTTDETGYLFTGLSPGTYTVLVTLGAVTKTLTATVGPHCDPITVTTTSFGQSFIEVVVQGCNGWIGGIPISVHQSGVLLGTATSLESLVAPPYVRIDFPGPTDGTPITIQSVGAPYFLNGSVTVADGTCQATAGVGTPDEAAGYACCGSSYFRVRPYGPTLNATLGSGDSVTLSGNGFGGFSGTFSKAVAGITDDCFTNTPGTVGACFHVGWSCGHLTIDYLGCVATNKARGSDCSATPNVHLTSSETSHVADPLVSTGSITGGYFAGTWTVTE